MNSEYKIQLNSEYKIQLCLPLKIPCLKTAYISGYIFMSSSYLLSGGPSLYHQSTYFITTSQKLNMGKNEFYNIKFNFHLPLRMPFVCQSLVHFRVNPYFIRPFYFISASQHHRILKMVGLNHKYNIQYSLTITNTMCQKCVHFKVQPYVIKTLSSQRVRLNIIEPLISQGQSSLIKFIWNK